MLTLTHRIKTPLKYRNITTFAKYWYNVNTINSNLWNCNYFIEFWKLLCHFSSVLTTVVGQKVTHFTCAQNVSLFGMSKSGNLRITKKYASRSETETHRQQRVSYHTKNEEEKRKYRIQSQICFPFHAWKWFDVQIAKVRPFMTSSNRFKIHHVSSAVEKLFSSRSGTGIPQRYFWTQFNPFKIPWGGWQSGIPGWERERWLHNKLNVYDYGIILTGAPNSSRRFLMRPYVHRLLEYI